MDRPESLGNFTWPSSLTSVQLAWHDTPTCMDDADPFGMAHRHAVSAAISAMLQKLPHLQSLDMAQTAVEPSALQHITAMQNLQDLAVLFDKITADNAHPSTVPCSLTQLMVNKAINLEQSAAAPAFLAAMPQLKNLLVLQLRRCTVPVADLAQLTSLQQLDLHECNMLPYGAMPHPWPETGAVLNSAGTAALLTALCQLTQMQRLSLSRVGLDTFTQPAQQSAALTASSRLQELQVTGTYASPVPLGAVQHMFPPGRCMGDLTTLTLRVKVGPLERLPLSLGCLDAQDLRTVLGACPALERLDIAVALTSSAGAQPLLQLPASCSVLHVGGKAFDDTAAPVVAQLTQLMNLEWAHADLTDAGLQQLTALTRLSRLLVDCSDLSGDLEYGIELTAGPGKPPVVEALDALLDSSPVCASQSIKQLHTRVAKLERKVAKCQALWQQQG